jgi:glycerophosphoryl diester phosphodiesterase
MLARLLSLDRVSVIAHRGGSKLRPENTVGAFDHACQLGVDALECDVHLSRDGEVVVIHDFALERTTDGVGPVEARTADELARLDAGFHFQPDRGHPYRGRGEGVPRLADLLARYPSIPMVIEIKGDRPEVAEATVAVVRQANATGRVIIGGFSDPVLKAVRRLVPGTLTGASGPEARAALTRSYFFLTPSPTGYRLFQMPLRLRGRQTLRRSFVQSARRAGIPVQAWVVDEPDDMRRLIDWGVTGIISDRPDVALEVRNDWELGTGNSHSAIPNS